PTTCTSFQLIRQSPEAQAIMPAQAAAQSYANGIVERAPGIVAGSAEEWWRSCGAALGAEHEAEKSDRGHAKRQQRPVRALRAAERRDDEAHEVIGGRCNRRHFGGAIAHDRVHQMAANLVVDQGHSGNEKTERAYAEYHFGGPARLRHDIKLVQTARPGRTARRGVF